MLGTTVASVIVGSAWGIHDGKRMTDRMFADRLARRFERWMRNGADLLVVKRPEAGAARSYRRALARVCGTEVRFTPTGTRGSKVLRFLPGTHYYEGDFRASGTKGAANVRVLWERDETTRAWSLTGFEAMPANP